MSSVAQLPAADGVQRRGRVCGGGVTAARVHGGRAQRPRRPTSRRRCRRPYAARAPPQERYSLIFFFQEMKYDQYVMFFMKQYSQHYSTVFFFNESN